MSANRLVTCPYDDAHKCKESRLQMHITKCRQNHLDEPKFTCPFNATHVYPIPEKDFHFLHCVDRAPLDRKLAQESLDKNNPFKGRTAVPHYSEPIRGDDDEESWSADEDAQPVGYRFRNEPPPAGAIIEPEASSKPAQRRELYMSLHQRPFDEVEPKKPTTPVPTATPRQPRIQSETSRIAHSQPANPQTEPNLGHVLGRGRPRIAANIFQPSPANGIQNWPCWGLGRGQPSGTVTVDEDEFPALGIGRGVSRNPPNGNKLGSGR